MTYVSLDTSDVAVVTTNAAGIHENATVSASMFGGILVNIEEAYDVVFSHTMQHVGLTHVRWPGGAMSETGSFQIDANGNLTFSRSGGDQGAWLDSSAQSTWNYAYDLAYPDVIAPDAAAYGAGQLSLSETLALAIDQNASFEMTFPMIRYSDIENVLPVGVSDLLKVRAGSDVASFLDRMLVLNQFGDLPQDIIFDIGNEGLVWERFDPNKQYDPSQKYDPDYVKVVFDEYFEVLESMLNAVRDFREENPGVEFKIAIQLPFMNNQPGLNDPNSVFESHLRSLPVDLLAQIDMVRAHSLDKEFEQGADYENWFSDEIQRALEIINTARNVVGVVDDAELNISAWTSNGDTHQGPGADFSLQSASATVAHFASLVEMGADVASSWGVAVPNSDHLQVSRYDPAFDQIVFTPRAEILRMLSESVIGTSLLSNPNFSDLSPNGPVNIQAFADESKTVIFVSANDIGASGETVTIDLTNLVGEISYVWAESIYATGNGISAPLGEAFVWNPMFSTIPGDNSGHVDLSYTSNSITLTLSTDYEIIRLIVSDTTPGAGQLYLIGDSLSSIGLIDDSLIGGSASDEIYGVTGDDTISGGNGNDTLVGGAGRDFIQGGLGNDELFGGTDDDRLFGDDGADSMFGELGDDTQFGGFGIDIMSGGDGDDFLFGGSGNDHVSGDNGADLIFGESGSDTLFGGDGPDILFGGADDDNLIGGAGDDRLFGQGGADWLEGGEGNDVLLGEDGSDVFVFAGNFGSDTILDFDASLTGDRIDLAGVAGVADFADLLTNHTVELDGNVMLLFGNGAMISLHGVALADLSADNFMF